MGLCSPCRSKPFDQPQSTPLLCLWIIGKQAWQTPVQVAHRDMQQITAQFSG